MYEKAEQICGKNKLTFRETKYNQTNPSGYFAVSA